MFVGVLVCWCVVCVGVCDCVWVGACMGVWVCGCVCVQTRWRATFCLRGSRQNVQFSEAIFGGGFARSKHIPILIFSRDGSV